VSEPLTTTSPDAEIAARVAECVAKLGPDNPPPGWSLFTWRMNLGQSIPDYATDANAVRALEMKIDADEVLASKYAKEVFEITCGNDFMAITASPRQRCVAMLRAHGVEVKEAV